MSKGRGISLPHLPGKSLSTVQADPRHRLKYEAPQDKTLQRQKYATPER